LQRLLVEALPPQERSPLETHIEHCPRCQQTLEQLTEDSLLCPLAAADTWAGAPLLELRDQAAGDGRPGPGNANGTADSLSPATDEPLSLAFLAPATRPEALGRLGHYEVLEVLGQGGFGIVFRAHDDVLQRVVAIKVLAPALAATSAARKRFLREARAAALVRHGNVVQTYAVEEQPLPYLVMEFIAGETLQQRLDRTGPFDAAEVAAIGRQIAEGLAAAHAAGLIHRDVKPGNVLIESGPGLCVKLTDFGLARAADDASLTQSGVVAGTPMYMSPEQARGEALDPRSDLFSLGSVLYAITTGQPPFRADNPLAVLKRVAEDAPQPILELIPETPVWLCDLSARLHAKEASARIQSATVVATLLAQGEAGVLPSLPRPVRRPARGRWPWWVGGGVLGLAAAGLLGFALTRPDADTDVSSPDPGQATSAATPTPTLAEPTYRNALGMEFVLVRRGRFWMGGGRGTPGSREVAIPYDFYLGKYEVTQEEWQKLMGKNPSGFSRTGKSMDAVKDVPDEELKRFPVEMVNWFEAQSFVQRLTGSEPDPGWVYRLPRETEWEYACRGGPMTDRSESAFDYYVDRPTNQLRPDQANFRNDQGPGRTCRVGSYPPNRLGLHDMHGNVNEWCEESVRGAPAPRVHRGGSWEFDATDCAARRCRALVPPVDRHDSLGLRVARVPADRE
jgi:formylglycine-generating enzyme required for sulfatase activity